MQRYSFFLLLFILLAVPSEASAQEAPSRANGIPGPGEVYCSTAITTSDCDLVRKVSERILAVAELPHDKHTWPPAIYVHDQKDDDGNSVLNAFAHPCSGDLDAGLPHECGSNEEQTDPHVHITKRLLEDLIQGREERLGFVFGHEVGHITQGHTTPFAYKWRANTEVAFMTFGRRQEMEADRVGHLYGLSAGYSSDDLLQAIFRFIELDLSYSSFEGLGVGHPSWEERLSYINEDNLVQWRALNTFRTGVAFLATEQYVLAESCFRDVIARYPASYESHANLGYALLMRYADALETADVQQLGIGHVVVGSFTRRPESLEPDVRGIDRQLWFQATTALNEALRLKPDLIEAKANLGIAYMIHPSGPDTDRARALLDEVAVAAANDNSMDPRARAAVLINSGVADLAAGLLSSSQEQLISAESQINSYASSLRSSGDVTVHGELYAALQYNAGLLFEKQATPKGQSAAFEFFERYLSLMSPSSAWWPIAYEKYSRIGKQLGRAVSSTADFRFSTSAKPRPVSGVTINNGTTITLGQPRVELGADLEKAYGAAASISFLSTLLQEDTDLTEFNLMLANVRVVATHEVIAIIIDEGGPAVEIRDVGLGTESRHIEVGMSANVLDQTLGTDYEKRVIIDPEKGYRFYRNAGVAAHVSDGMIRELVLTQVPIMHAITPETE